MTSNEPNVSLVRRRKWVRHLRAAAGGNLPTAYTEGARSSPETRDAFCSVRSTVCPTPRSAMAAYSDSHEFPPKCKPDDTKSITQALDPPPDLPPQARRV